jgi:hypothetical protein
MKQDGTSYPVLLKKRGFSEVFDDLGRFVRTAYKPFLKVMAYVPGPFILLTGLLSAYGGFLAIGGTSSELTALSIPVLIFVMLLSFFTSLLNLGSGIFFMKGMEEEGKPPSVKTVRDKVFSNFGDLFICFIAWVGILLVFSFFVGIALGLFMVPLGGIAPVLAPIFFFLFFLFVMPPIAFTITASFFGMLRDGLQFGQAFAKAWRLLFSAFWRTWGVMVVGTLLFMILSFACMIPEALFTGAYSFLSLDLPFTGGSGFFLSVLALLRYFITQILWIFFVILQGLHYYSLHEMESGEALLSAYDRSASDV